MKTFSELTKSALAARQNNISRAEFLAALEPAERSNGALQFDRATHLNDAAAHGPSEEEIAAESRRIAVAARLAEYCEENPSAYGSKLLSYMLGGRLMSAGMEREATPARAYADNVSASEIADARSQALENLSMDKSYLAARLGVAA